MARTPPKCNFTFPVSVQINRSKPNQLTIHFFNSSNRRRQWYGLPCDAEEEEVPEMGEGRARTGEGRPEGSREADASVEESGKGASSRFKRSPVDQGDE